MPPALFFVGSSGATCCSRPVWLLAAAIVFAAAGRDNPTRIQRKTALGCALRCPLRPNALIAATNPRRLYCLAGANVVQASAILLVPRWRGFSRCAVVYYGALGATRQHPLQSDHGVTISAASALSGEWRFR